MNAESVVAALVLTAESFETLWEAPAIAGSEAKLHNLFRNHTRVFVLDVRATTACTTSPGPAALTS